MKTGGGGDSMVIFLRLCYTITNVRKGEVLYAGKQG